MIQNTPCRRRHKPNPPPAPTDEDTQYEAFVPKRFAEALTADHVVLAADDAADRHGDKYALVVLDKYTGIIMAFPAKHKDAEHAEAVFRQFLAANDEVNHIYTDSSGELLKACRKLGWRHDTSTTPDQRARGACG